MTSKERRRALRKLHNPLWHGDDESAPSLTWLINRGKGTILQSITTCTQVYGFSLFLNPLFFSYTVLHTLILLANTEPVTMVLSYTATILKMKISYGIPIKLCSTFSMFLIVFCTF